MTQNGTQFNNSEPIPEEIQELWGEHRVVETAPENGQSFNFLQPADVKKNYFQKFSHVKRPILTFASLIVIVVLALQGAGFVASALETKENVALNANVGLASLKEAQGLLSAQDFTSAEQKLLIAKQSFENAQTDLQSLGSLINSVLKISKQGAAADSLLAAGEKIASSGISFNKFRELFAQVKITAQGFLAPDGFYGTVNAAKKHLQSANDDLEEASKALSRVDASALPPEFASEYLKYRESLSAAVTLFSHAENLVNMLQKFVGQGPKSILVLFENNNELRASGGFIGTYGFYKLQNGEIISQKISSVYDLDGQVDDKIAPPGPFFELTNRWGLRDSNWFADFRNSAAKASSFYEKTGLETPDAVIALTPDIFEDLLTVTGPINFPKYGLALDADNFRKEVQAATSEEYDKEANEPKQLLADFAPLFLQVLSDLPEDKKPLIMTALLDNLRTKNILLYDRNPEVQKTFEEYNWAGKLASATHDYLSIVNSNLGGKKTDLDIDQSVTIKSEIVATGEIVNTLTYTRTQKMNLTRPDSNVVYTRFYVPEGSKLLAASGFTKKEHYASDGRGYYDYNDPTAQQYVVDKDLAKIDASIVVDASSGTAVGEESGKTFFGNWIQTNPGQSTTVVLRYKLPFKVTGKTYSLMVQKQPGNNPINFGYSITLPRNVSWYTPDSLKITGRKVELNNQLTQDIFAGVVLDER